MPFPEAARLELPILLELKATGGRDQPRYLYERLIRYFPQLTQQDLEEKTEAGRSRWNLLVQRAAGQLVTNGELRRDDSLWLLTSRGLKRIEDEQLQLEPTEPIETRLQRAITHSEAQQMLIEIGRMLGRHAEAEFDYYDVVWRDSATAPRLSHVFEVQISGSVDSALTRLKHAYDTQRSCVFLIVADERDQRFAGKRLTGSFHEIWDVINVIGTGELQRLYESLKAQQEILMKFTSRN